LSSESALRSSVSSRLPAESWSATATAAEATTAAAKSSASIRRRSCKWISAFHRKHQHPWIQPLHSWHHVVSNYIKWLVHLLLSFLFLLFLALVVFLQSVFVSVCKFYSDLNEVWHS